MAHRDHRRDRQPRLKVTVYNFEVESDHNRAVRALARSIVTMTGETRWHQNPQGFLDRRLRERGISVQKFLAARPGRWWEQLVREFDEPVAPVQLEAYVQAAAARGTGWTGAPGMSSTTRRRRGPAAR
jgi:hypothetical protein